MIYFYYIIIYFIRLLPFIYFMKKLFTNYNWYKVFEYSYYKKIIFQRLK